jgi:ABC-type dipeptide/oligopeptide/nickel transport system ATPase component
MIALAIAAEPDLLIADEPTTALDATVQAEILDLLRHMRTSLNLSILLITHDLGVIAQMANRVAVIRRPHRGTGASRRDLSITRAPYTRGLLACVPEPSRARDSWRFLEQVRGPASCRRAAHLRRAARRDSSPATWRTAGGLDRPEPDRSLLPPWRHRPSRRA